MIGVDIGGTNVLVGIAEDGRIIERLHETVNTGDFEHTAKQVCRLITTIQNDTKHDIGICVAGSVDVKKGVVLHAQNLQWKDAPLADFVTEKLKCKVIIENDVTSSAWGEFQHGAGRDCESMFAVWVGTGIGGGLILDHAIWRGPLGTGGEFGMGISEPTLNSTNRTLESIASRSGYQTILNNPILTTSDLVSSYGNDKELTLLLEDGARRIGTAIANTITLLSLDRVVLGGGLIEALGQSYVDLIRSQFDLDVFPKHCQKCELKITELGPDAGLLGATSLLHE